MYSRFNKDNSSLSEIDMKNNYEYNSTDFIEDKNVEVESKIDSIVRTGDNFINMSSLVFETFMGLMNWIMRYAYLIAVLIVAILFVFKLKV